MNSEDININPEEIRKILVINLGGIGDLLLSTPALRALKNSYPYAQLYLLVTAQVFELAKDLHYIDGVFVFNLHLGLGETLNNLKTLLILRKRKPDLAINMRTLASKRGALKIEFLFDVINPKVKVGRDTEGRGGFFDIKISETDMGEKYEMDYDIETSRALGADVLDRSVDFEIDKGSLKKINRILEKEGISNNDILIGINPGGKISHRWPLENFVEALDKINKKIFCKFVITGGKDEVRLTQEFMRISNVKIANLAGRLSIRELGTLIKRCGLYICNDTGPMHIAAILKTPLIAIFGPGDIIRFDPRNISDRVVVLHKKVACAPCNRTSCSSKKCLRAISPQDVIEAASGLLMKERDN